MRILFLGTSEFALPTLQKLIENNQKVVAVVTAPDKPSGRRKSITPSPIKKYADNNRLNVLQPSTLENHTLAGELRRLNADIGIVVAYGKMIPKEIIDLPAHGILNLHPSLLPKYRGPSPVQYALINGDSETGVTVIKLDEKMDHGDIVVSEAYIVGPEVKYEELQYELANLGARVLLSVLADYVEGKIRPTPQDHSKATYTKLISKQDGMINWTNPARDIYNRFRAFHKWPGVFTKWRNKILKIVECKVAASPIVLNNDYLPGAILNRGVNVFIVCEKRAHSFLEIVRLQLEGGRPMSAQEFINGYGKYMKRIVI